MDYFAIVSLDVKDSTSARASAVDPHRQRLKDLNAQNRLLTAGPLPQTNPAGEIVDGCQGSIIIAAFDDLESARNWARADPYNDAGVYAQTDVYPYKKVF